ncbi:MAG: YdcF family protein [Elusimicrobiales bacterium]|nr:YdcF family protein [Elusimicrobiales bacterium]
MFLLKKIIEAFVLPPGIIVVFLAGGTFYFRRRARAAAVVMAVLACGGWIGSTGAFSDLLLRPLENTHRAPAKPEGDVIVLLCGGFRGGWKPFSASERLAPGTLERAAAAHKLHKLTGLPVLVSGGAPFSAEPESEAAAAYLEELGVPRAKLLTEVRSRDTQENAAYSVALCREKNFKKIILLTSAYHMPRAALLFRGEGAADLVPFPVARRTGGARYLNDYLPGGGGGEARQALNEYFGLIFYNLYYFSRQ